MIGLVLREMARWVRAIGAPLSVAVTVVVTPTLLRGPIAMLVNIVPDRAVSMTWTAAVAGAMAWLLIAGVRAAVQPVKDARASERLQDLRERSAMPQHALVYVTEVHWTSSAGQRVAAVDVRTGAVREIWIAERAVEPGAFALIVGAAADDHLSAREVVGARRHERLSAARRNVHRHRPDRRARRLRRRQAAEVVRAAEDLLGWTLH